MNKELYYEIYSEFYSVNKFRELKSVINHGNNSLNHINRVAKMSFMISKKLGLDYISCTRGAILHNFLKNNLEKNKYKESLKNYEILNEIKNYFEINDIESDIILSHRFPVVGKKPTYMESRVVCLVDKLVSVYEFFKYRLKLSII